jgi:hypothetical protein
MDTLPTSPQPHRKITVASIATDGLDNSERLLAYFPQLNGSRCSSGSHAGTPTYAETISSKSGPVIHRIRSSSPTDGREDVASGPHLLLRRMLKMPMKSDGAKSIKEQFLSFDSSDSQDDSYFRSGVDVPSAYMIERADSLASMNTSQPDEISCHNSPQVCSDSSANRKHFNSQDVDDSAAAISWQQHREYFEPKMANDEFSDHHHSKHK